MDISTLVYKDERKFFIKGPDGKVTTWEITVAGPGHAVTSQIQEMVASRNDRLSREEADAKRRNKVYSADSREEREFFTSIFAMRVLNWSPVSFSGVEFPCTDQNKLVLFKDAAYGFIATQINEACGELENFMPKTSET